MVWLALVVLCVSGGLNAWQVLLLHQLEKQGYEFPWSQLPLVCKSQAFRAIATVGRFGLIGTSLLGVSRGFENMKFSITAGVVGTLEFSAIWWISTLVLGMAILRALGQTGTEPI